MNTLAIVRRRWLFLLFILLVAACLRLYRLDAIPPGFQFDEAYNATDAARVLAGERPLFLEANGGREVLYTYLQALSMAVLGNSIFALRLVSALVGLLTVGLTYLLVETLLAEGSHAATEDGVEASAGSAGGDTCAIAPTSVALLASAFTAITYWHIHFSRYGIRGITLPLLEVLLFLTFWKGLQTRRPAWWILSGVVLGLGPYTHTAGRFLPFIITVFVLYKALTDRSARPALLWQWLTMAALAVLLFLPLGRYFWLHPEAFTGHASLVSAFNPEVSGGNPPGMLLGNALTILGMFAVRGDGAWNHNYAGRPVFDPLAALCLAIGLVVLIVGLWRSSAVPRRRDAYVFLVIWLAVMLSPSLLSSGAPDFSRTIGSLPALFVLPALGLAAVGQWLGARRRLLAALLVAVVLAFSAGSTIRDYFFRFPQVPDLYHIYDVDKIEVVGHLREWAREGQVYLSPLWAEHATVAFLTRGLGLKSFDTGETVVLPSRVSGKDAIYVFSWEQTPYIDSFAERMAPLTERVDVPNSRGGALLTVLRVKAQNLPDPARPLDSLAERGFRLLPQHSVRADFGGSIALLGYTLPQTVPAGSAEPVTLFWQATGKIRDDYTVFLHAVDGRGRRWAQEDRRPNQGGYPTNVWAVGDIVIDRYWPAVDPCAPPGEVQLLAGLYTWPDGQRVAVTGSGLDSVPLGSLEVTPAEKLTLRDRKPQHAINRDFEAVRLLGYDDLPAQAVSGDIIGLNLYWQALSDVGSDRGWGLGLRSLGSPGEARQVWNGQPAVPTSRWRKGNGVCTHHDVTLPPDTASGDYELTLALSDHTDPPLSLGTVHIVNQPRTFALPTPQHPLTAAFGEAIRLLGYNLPQSHAVPGGSLPVTLYWQAAGPLSADYTVFVHLLDGQERVQSQWDSAPAGGTRPTTGWLPGEVVSDTCTLTLPPTVPPGTYRLEAGLYQPLTGKRLPVFQESAQPLPGDRLLLNSTIEVSP